MRIKLMQLIVAITLLPTANLWAQAELRLTNISLNSLERKLDVKDCAFQLNADKSEENVLVLTTDRETKVSMKSKVRRMNSRISQHKATGIRLTTVYYCQYKGEKRKNKTERVFWPDKNEGFTENVSFSFNKGKLKTEVMSLKFNGEIKFF